MRRFLLTTPMLITVLLVVGCTTDKAVSIETRNLADSLMQVSEDFQKDSTRYLAQFEANASTELDIAEAKVIKIIEESGGDDKDEKIAAVKKVFGTRQEKLKENIAKARAAYRERVQVLQLASDMVIAVDGYYQTRLYAPWKAIGGGLARGVFSKASVILDMVGKITNNPIIIKDLSGAGN